MRGSLNGITLLYVFVMVATAPAGGTAQHRQPRADAPPVLRSIELVFPTQENVSLRPRADYLALMELPSLHPLGDEPVWVPYTQVELLILNDAQRLWASGLLHSLWVEVFDDPFENGVIGRRLVFNIVERLQVGAPPEGFPEPPPGYELPPVSRERVYPPQAPL
jgi:hypothetical protein